MATSIARSNGPAWRPRSRSSSISRVNTWLARSTMADEQVVFAAGQRHLDLVGVDQAAPGRLQRPVGEAVGSGDVRSPAAALVGPAQHRPDPRQQLAGVKGFWQVIVRTQFEADDTIRLLAHRGQHDDRHVGHRAEPAREVEPGFAGEHQVEDDELVVAGRPGAACLPAIPRRGDAQPMLLQEAREQVADFPVVVDQQDMRGRFHCGVILRCLWNFPTPLHRCGRRLMR